MDFLKNLKAHKGGLLRIKTQLYWYGSGGWDGVPGRVCLVLDAAAAPPHGGPSKVGGYALLLIDDRPQWVWVTEADVELIT